MAIKKKTVLKSKAIKKSTNKNQKYKSSKEIKKRGNHHHLYIPLFGLLGIGIGFYFERFGILGGLILGLGVGFLIEGLVEIIKEK